PVGSRAHLQVTFDGPRPEPDLSAFDHFLTARHRLYSTVAGRLVVADAEHPPWPLRRARATGLRQDLTRAAGLPDPDHGPPGHASAGVRVRVSRWRRAWADRRHRPAQGSSTGRTTSSRITWSTLPSRSAS